MTAPPSLAQIVAALSVTYTTEGVLIWLNAMHVKRRNGLRDLDKLAEAVRLIGDADPSDFTVTEARQ